MSSTLSARLVLFALWMVGTLVSSAAQMRVIKADPPRRRRYLLAWFGCALVGGGLLSAMDDAIGLNDWTRRSKNILLAAAVFAAALSAGAWLTQRPQWTRMHGVLRFLTLAGVHAVVVFVIAYFFV